MKTSRYRKRLQKSRRQRKFKKNITKKLRTLKKSTRKRRGGSSTSPGTISTTPSQSYGFDHGSSPRTNATNFQSSQNATQQNLNNTHGGAKKRRGGSATSRPKSLDVPQFSQQGPAIGPQDANNTSVATNTSSVAGTVNATNDCYATNSCATKGGSRKKYRAGRKGRVKRRCMSGGKRTRRGGSRRVLWGCMS